MTHSNSGDPEGPGYPADPYSVRLAAAIAKRGRLCVGIDPHPSLISTWGLMPDVVGLEKFSRGLVAAIGQRVAVLKPQSALFEAYGSGGVAVLERVICEARAAGAVVLLDAKRGDFQPSMFGYARAYLMAESPLAVDALTVSPYLGVGSLQPAFDAARASGKGLYVLARTSNPEGAIVQLARTEQARTVAQQIVDDVQVRNAAIGPEFGVVVGGTHDDLGLDLSGFAGSVLVPGIGAQGASIADLGRRFAAVKSLILPTTSRAVAAAGPDPQALRDEVDRLVAEVASLD